MNILKYNKQFTQKTKEQIEAEEKELAAKLAKERQLLAEQEIYGE